jgi:hypothetical protein
MLRFPKGAELGSRGLSSRGRRRLSSAQGALTLSPNETGTADRSNESELVVAIRRFFLDDAADDPASRRFEVLFASSFEGSSRARISTAVERLEGGAHVAIVHHLERETALARVLALLTLPVRLLATERHLRSAEVEALGRFALAPSLESPWLLYQLGTAAAGYAESELLAGMRPSGVKGLFHGGASLWAGCSPAVGLVVVLGKKK